MHDTNDRGRRSDVQGDERSWGVCDCVLHFFFPKTTLRMHLVVIHELGVNLKVRRGHEFVGKKCIISKPHLLSSQTIEHKERPRVRSGIYPSSISILRTIRRVHSPHSANSAPLLLPHPPVRPTHVHFLIPSTSSFNLQFALNSSLPRTRSTPHSTRNPPHIRNNNTVSPNRPSSSRGPSFAWAAGLVGTVVVAGSTFAAGAAGRRIALAGLGCIGVEGGRS